MSVSLPAFYSSLLAFALLVLPALAVPAQRLFQGSKPVKEKIPEYSESYCSRLTAGFRLCKVRTSAENDDAAFIVRKGTETVRRMDGAAWKTITVEPDAFFAYRGDLDGNGSSDVVLVTLDGVSNGMGVSYSTAYIFDGGVSGQSAEPISFSIHEFSPQESFVYDPASRRTEILISYWAEYATLEPKRVPGVYLIGKRFRYRDGRLEPVAEKPTLARRFLNSFANERANDESNGRRPHTWLKDRRTISFTREPAESAKPVRVSTGTIIKFVERPSAEDPAAEIEVSTDSGVVNAKIRGDWNADGQKDKLEVTSVGLRNSRYVYPLSWSMEFVPSTFLDRIEGRRVRLETYKTEYGDEYTKLWLLD